MKDSIIPGNEVWKEIDWIDGIRCSYEVSNYGNVRRTSMLRHEHYSCTYQVIHKTRYLTPSDNGHGYKTVCFYVYGKRKNYYVHRLVAEAFIDNPNNERFVNHKNYIRSDNRAENLEWCSVEENINYSKEHLCQPKKASSGIRYKNGKYEVEVHLKNTAHYLGRYSDYSEALQVRNCKLKELGAVVNV